VTLQLVELKQETLAQVASRDARRAHLLDRSEDLSDVLLADAEDGGAFVGPASNRPRPSRHPTR
jgi:hypothetical protein